MSNSNKKSRKTRSDKFPLTLHKTGQYCKKIRGKIYYFGTDKNLAYQRYLEQAAFLHNGNLSSQHSKENGNDISIKCLCNLYIEHQRSRAEIGQIKLRHVYEQTTSLRSFVKFIGAVSLVGEIKTVDLQSFIQKLIRSKKAANTINNRIAVIKAMFNWALENDIITHAPNLKAVKKITKIKKEKFTFSIDQIHKLLEHADVQMKAMIFLGLNCGFGCTDCAELKWKNLDLKNSRVIFPRGKTGVLRNLSLWPETIQALKAVPKNGELVFYTVKGNPWVRVIQRTDEAGNEKLTKDDAVTKQFSKLLRKTGIKVLKGVGFYTLRRTAATLAARSGDPFAVQRILGHTDLKMASVYVQDVSEQTDRVIDNTRRLIIRDDS